jgi:MFS family permease
MEQIARPILVLALTGSALHLGMILAARMIPQLILGLWAGVIADWFDRKKVLIISKSGAAIVNFVLAGLVLSGNVELWHVYATTMIKGLFMALDQPARQSLIPSIVPEGQVTNAVALNSATMNMMRIGGAAVSGLLLATAGIGWTYMTVSVVFLGAVFFTSKIQVPSNAITTGRNLRGAKDSLKEGFKFAWGSPSIRSIIVLALVFFAFGMSYMQVFAPLFAKQVLEIGDRGFGFLMSTTGAGALVGALTLATVNPQRRRGLALMGVMIAFGLMLILFSISTFGSPLAVSFGIIALIGMFQTPYHALQNAILLDSAPENMRGRIMALVSLDRVVIMGGGTLAGFLAEVLGAQIAQIIFGSMCIIGVLFLALFMPDLRKVQ